MQNTLQVIIETPKGSGQKFDYDPTLSLFLLSKALPLGMIFPFDFGFLPSTLGEDGDPLDVLVISEFPTFTGCVVECRIIGGIKAMQTERDGTKTRNDRYLAIPNISQTYSEVQKLSDLNASLLLQIEEFFINYNELAGKSFKIEGHFGVERAMKLIDNSRQGPKLAQKLIQLFLPLRSSEANKKKLSKLEKLLIQKFGGVSSYFHNPVAGKWMKKKNIVQDELLVFEVMVPMVEEHFWKAFKVQLQNDFQQNEILIRYLDMSTIAD